MSVRSQMVSFRARTHRYIISIISILDLSTGPVDTFNLYNFSVLYGSSEGYIWMPSVLLRVNVCFLLAFCLRSSREGSLVRQQAFRGQPWLRYE